MKIDYLLDRLNEIGKNKKNVFYLTDSKNNRKKMFILPNDIIIQCFIYLMQDMNIKENKFKTSMDIEKHIELSNMNTNLDVLKIFTVNNNN